MILRILKREKREKDHLTAIVRLAVTLKWATLLHVETMVTM